MGRLASLSVRAVGAALLLAALPATASPAGHSQAWTRTGLGAVTQPAAVGARFVLYGHRGRALDVVALNAADGSTAWTAAASASHLTPGVPAELAVRGDAVFYLAPAPGPVGTATVVARDVSSGRVVWHSQAGAFTTWPELCPDDAASICVDGAVPGVGFGELRYAAASGRALHPAPIGTPSNPGRELGFGLFDAGTRSPEELLAASGGRVAWREPLARIFTEPRATSDGGWNFDRLARLGLFVGSVGTRPTIANGVGTENLGHLMTAGFAVSSGKVSWRSPGLYSCGQPLPCPGRSEAGYSSPATAARAPTVGIRLVEKGIITGSVSGGTPRLSPGASVTIQGFDPASGRTRWSFAAGRNLALLSGQSVPARIDASSIVVTGRDGRRVALDLRTGKTRSVPAASRAWCETAIQYHLANTGYFGGKSGLYIGQNALYPCTSGGRRTAAPGAVPGFVGRIGASAGGLTAWTDTNAVHAAPGATT